MTNPDEDPFSNATKGDLIDGQHRLNVLIVPQDDDDGGSPVT